MGYSFDKFCVMAIVLFAFCSCAVKKEDNEPFCSIELMSKSCLTQLDIALDYADFIKVGQTYKFANVHYLDKLSMPEEWTYADLSITFNDDNSFTVENKAGRTANYKVKCFDVVSEYYGDDYNHKQFVTVTFYTDEGRRLQIFKQKNSPECGKNEYGVTYEGETFNYSSAKVIDGAYVGSFFDY